MLGAFGVQGNRGAIDDAVPAFVVADDVVIEDRFDGDVFRDGFLRVQTRTYEPLLLTGVAHEDQRRFEVDAALTEDARELDGQRRAAPIVVDAGCAVVERCIRIDRRRRRGGGIRRGTARVGHSLTAGARHPVVGPPDFNAAGTLFGAKRPPLAELRVPPDAAPVWPLWD